ncbi:cation ABC transporter, ATP-binding protein [Campylobacter volucris]|uniref:Cation ABC transporter, ATP-binding protein n=1 Tax=Campylobacter volucris TaxID=1031542 RepID=A0AAE6D060_9BACT|nr:cation ABC transporter, ATP-binding protein [Campylobacter volucris]AJC93389.1 metal ion ABC transporter, ATP-binding protein [Campylobacter volucris LMG 24379]KAB0579626.1 cation ABC transporter, ATP-binding protein [Campylobacter volucris]QBL14215.1 cation ABC transporter, ATP-binding protein [Campylobacter volucris]QEL07602.1 metal ion ABC transporter, ATP-binding protein [Campylobacter volucris]TXK66558.1 cation ABC transporter, ATP-binding protein [Campylobacter volucris]
MELFQISNLNFSYNEELVLKNINLSYDNNDFLSIIGPNGGGKSTLIKLIFGLLKSKNIIEFKNINLNQIGYVPQNTLTNTNFPTRVLEVVLMGRINHKTFGFYTKKDKELALDALKKVSMQDFWDKTISSLSSGQRQRVLIARALVGECKLLILDEPTASVDTKNAIQIFELLKQLHQNGMGIICISHDINITLAYSDKIAYLNKEIFIHKNIKDPNKINYIKHLYQNHSHFCDVEMSLNSCLCKEYDA